MKKTGEMENYKDIKDKQKNKIHNLNSRGTKKAVPTIVLDKKIQNDIKEMSLVELKKKYIPMYARHEISTKEICNIFGHTIDWACRIRKQYLAEGENFSFEHKNKGHPSYNKKITEEIERKIVNLYETEYKGFSINEYSRIIIKKYNLNLSITSISSVLHKNGIKSPTSDKYLGKTKETLGNDLFAVMKLFMEGMNKKTYSEIEEFGLIQLCDLAFVKAYSALNSISKKKFKLKFRTTYSLFEYFIDKNYLQIKELWIYWNNNHDKFSYVYDNTTRYKVIYDIKNYYYPMFIIIENYIKEMKDKID